MAKRTVSFIFLLLLGLQLTLQAAAVPQRVSMCVDPEWLPYERLAGQKHEGMIADYYRELAEHLDFQIEIVPTASWSESLEAVKSGRCQLISGMMRTKEREAFLDFTKSYFTFPVAFATTMDTPFLNSLHTLTDKKIAIVESYAFNKSIRQRYPNLNFVGVKNHTQGLEMVHEEQVYGYIDALPTLSYGIQNSYFNDLKISGILDKDISLHIGVHKGDAQLVHALNEAIAKVDTAEKQLIKDKWLSVIYDNKGDVELLAQFLIAAVGLLLWGLYWNYSTTKSNKRLENSLQNFKVLFESVLEGMFLFDQKQRCIKVNAIGCEMFGYTREQMLQKSIPDLVDKNYLKKVERKLKKASPNPYELTCIKSDGSTFTMLVRGRDIIWNGRQIRLASGIDITHMKQLEQNLRNSKKMWEDMFYKHSAIFLIIDPENGQIIDANEAALRYYGYEKRELLAKTISDINNASKKEVVHEMERAKRENRNYFIFKHRLKSGKVRDVEVHSTPIKSSGKKLLFSIIHDITRREEFKQQLEKLNAELGERVKAEVQAKIESEKSYKNLFDNISDGVVICEVDGQGRPTYALEANQAVLQLTGYEYEEFLTVELQKLCGCEEKPSIEEVNSTQQELYRKDGSTFTAMVGADLFEFDGQQRAYIIVKDISETLRMEEQQAKQEQFLQHQSKLASMGEMIGAIAHQWRQPLNALNINIQNLIDDYEEGLIDAEFLEKYEEENTRLIRFMSKTIDDFRNFFRIDKATSRFMMQEVVNKTLSIQRAQLQNHDIQTRIEGEDFEVHGYKSEFEQVLLNLINNAKDAIIANDVDPGMITVRLGDRSLCVEDNAGGVPEEIIDRIMEPYFTTKEEGKGTGMGLYISKMIIENNMHGRLRVENGEKGAQFTIEL